jgi:hypothetical protein
MEARRKGEEGLHALQNAFAESVAVALFLILPKTGARSMTRGGDTYNE